MTRSTRSIARARIVTLLVTSAIAIAIAVAAAACAGTPDDSGTPRFAVAALDENAYATFVQPVIEKKCGSIDCHGQTPRGLRVYGMNGLRLPNDAGDVPGVGATTPDEARATFESILGLEPEKTNAFVLESPRSEDDAIHLLLLAKPLALERHRPGVSLRKGEPAEQCILGWLLTAPDATLCAAGR